METFLLDKLNKTYQEKINEYFNMDTKLVFGDGRPNSEIALVGEAPGKNEVIKGKPFVGQAGKNLDEFIEMLAIKRDDLYITNIVKMRPYKINPQTGRESNRPPTRKEIEIFTDFIKEELSIVKPKLIVTLGNVALKCIVDSDSAAIGNLHGSPLEVSFRQIAFKLYPLYHPASVIYRPELRKVYLEDLSKLKEYLKTLL